MENSLALFFSPLQHLAEDDTNFFIGREIRGVVLHKYKCGCCFFLIFGAYLSIKWVANSVILLQILLNKKKGEGKKHYFSFNVLEFYSRSQFFISLS